MDLDLVIAREDPGRADIVALLEAHLAFSHAQSPAEHVHALDLGGLRHGSVAFFAARQDGELLGVGALKQLGADRGELKSMHTAEAARGRGVGWAMVEHLMAEARGRGWRWLGLETGRGEPYEPAYRLYRAAGFVDCEPFGSYTDNPWSRCLALELPGEPADH
jgi:putative acetyltransferase